MTDRDRQRVGGVLRVRRLGHSEPAGHHAGDGALPGRAIAGERLLDAARTVFGDGQVGRRDQHRAAGMPERERRLRVRRAEHRLHRDFIGLKPLDDVADFPMEPLKAQHERFPGWTPDDAEVHDAQPAVRFVHGSPTRHP